MIATLLLSAVLTTQAQAQPAPAPAFQPRLHVKFQPRPPSPARADVEVVCGMLVVHKTPDDDPKILLPARRSGAAIRRIQPKGCTATHAVPVR